VYLADDVTKAAAGLPGQLPRYPHQLAQVYALSVDLEFGPDRPRASGNNLIVIRALGVTRRLTGTP
jgi:hypothetical protein